jgi:hypothetical protein
VLFTFVASAKGLTKHGLNKRSILNVLDIKGRDLKHSNIWMGVIIIFILSSPKGKDVETFRKDSEEISFCISDECLHLEIPFLTFCSSW